MANTEISWGGQGTACGSHKKPKAQEVSDQLGGATAPVVDIVIILFKIFFLLILDNWCSFFSNLCLYFSIKKGKFSIFFPEKGWKKFEISCSEAAAVDAPCGRRPTSYAMPLTSYLLPCTGFTYILPCAGFTYLFQIATEFCYIRLCACSMKII